MNARFARIAVCTLTYAWLSLTANRAPAAPIPAYATTSVTTTFSNTGTLGFTFTPQRNIIVKELGYYDHGTNGLVSTPPIGWPLVGLWHSNGTPIVQTSVTTSNRLEGLYRYATIPDTVLTAGTTYVIGGRSEGNPVTWTGGSTVAFDPEIVPGVARWHPSSNLNFPTNSAPGFIYNMPNFTYAIPEPASLALVGLAGLALLGLVGIARRRK